MKVFIYCVLIVCGWVILKSVMLCYKNGCVPVPEKMKFGRRLTDRGTILLQGSFIPVQDGRGCILVLKKDGAPYALHARRTALPNPAIVAKGISFKAVITA